MQADPDFHLHVIQANIQLGHQICHSTEGSGRVATSLCRGARDWFIQYFHRVGFLEEPTDECWEKKQRLL